MLCSRSGNTECVNFFSTLRLKCFRLVNKINGSIGQDPNSKFLIGVLDIYGFESFKTNRCLTGMLLFSSFMVVNYLVETA